MRITIVALAAAKGGVGKTTLCAALATAAALADCERLVGMIDLDPQGSLTFWSNRRSNPRPILFERGRSTLAQAVGRAWRAGVGLLFLDCPPGFSGVLEEAIACADLALVPTQASALDLAAVSSTAEMTERLGTPHRFVLNRPVFRSRIAGQAVTALRERSGMLGPPIHQRVAIPEAMTGGRTVVETDPGCPAGRELLALWAGVDSLIPALPPRRSVVPEAPR